MASELGWDRGTSLSDRIRVSRDRENSVALLVLIPPAIWGVVAAPIGGFLWWLCIAFLAMDAVLFVVLWRARRFSVHPLERAIAVKTLHEKPVTSFITYAAEIRAWMTVNDVVERTGRTPRRDDLSAVIVRPTGMHAIVSDRGQVKDLLVISADAIADVQAVRSATANSHCPLLRMTFTTSAAPLELDLYSPTATNTFFPDEHAAATTAESIRRVLRLPREDDTLVAST